MAMVPDKLVDEVALVGPSRANRRPVNAWKASPVKTMLIGTRQIDTIRALAEAAPVAVARDRERL